VEVDTDIGALKVLEKDGTTTIRPSIDRPGKRDAAGTEFFLSDHVAGAASQPLVRRWKLATLGPERRDKREGPAFYRANVDDGDSPNAAR